VYVDDNAPGDPGPGNPLISDPAENGSEAHPFDSIQQAIDFSDPNFVSEVIILSGTYTGNGNRDIDFKGKPITVRGINPDDPNIVAATVIDCQGTAAQPHRGFYFHTGETATSVLKGLTITNGYGLLETVLTWNRYAGGGIFCSNASPRVESIAVTRCSAESGGALAGNNSDVHLFSCHFTNNTVTRFGGGGAFYGGQPLLDKCVIADNSAAQSSGGIGFEQSNPRMLSCRIFRNKAPEGGGIVFSRSAPEVTDCEILSNTTTQRGGGGVYLLLCDSPADFRNCVFSGNYSKSNGGAAYVETSLVDFSNCTFAGNRAVTGGGIYGEVDYLFGTSVQLKDCIVWGNEAARGNQIAFGSSDEPAAGGLQAWYSDIEGGIAAVFQGSAGIGFYEGTIDADPLFADPGRWLDNGTPQDPSDDTWLNGDYHLKSYAGRWDPAQEKWVMDNVHSPCIDAGDPTSDSSQEPAYNGGRINMGAYGGSEYASKTPNCPQPPVGDLDNDCKVTFADLALFASSWLDCNLEPPIACE
jgi:predicted outer membrane repeat protein